MGWGAGSATTKCDRTQASASSRRWSSNRESQQPTRNEPFSRDPWSEECRQVNPLGVRASVNTYAYAFEDPLRFADPNGLKPYEFQIRIGGGIGHLIVGGFVYTATIRDVEKGETCNYQIRCLGLGVGLPEVGVTSLPVAFDDGKTCSKCKDFEGLGYMGGAYAQAGGGATIGGGMKIPNGPFIANDYLSWDRGAFRIGVSHNACYFRFNN